MLCHQVCQTRHGKKITSISAHFLFKVRCDKWPVSVPPEQNMTPAEAACPCFQSLPAFSFFSTHTHTLTSLPLSFHLNSIFLSSLEDPLHFSSTFLFLHHHPLTSTLHRQEREANIIPAEEQVRVKRRPQPSLPGIKRKQLGEAGVVEGGIKTGPV